MAAQFERACSLLSLQLEATPVVVACSGGADSACLLALVRKASPQSTLVACYVNHGLRPRASIGRDIAAVRQQARASGADVEIRKAALGATRDGSPEERARVARYAELEAVAQKHGASIVLTGHQRDDLVETSLLALARGSGIDGVAAMSPKRPLTNDVALARPLLWATKAQCVALVQALGLPYSEDETNLDHRFPRNAIRAFVRQLETALPQTVRGVARSAALLADDKELLDGMSAAAWQKARIGESFDLSTARLRGLPTALLRRVIRHALRVAGSGLRDVSFEHCDAIARAIKQRRGGLYHAGKASVVLSSGKMIVADGGARRLSLDPIFVRLGQKAVTYSTPLGTVKLRVCPAGPDRKSMVAQQLDATKFRNGDVVLRLPRNGDVCIPSGHTRAVSLARFLGKAGVPKPRRDQVVLLCAGGRIAAVLGLRVMAPFQPKARSPILEVGWIAADI